MTNSSPPNPPPSNEEQRIRRQIRRRTREETQDEWIAILVAFGTIGAILLWTLGFRKNNFLTTNLSSTNISRLEKEAGENFNINREVSTNIETSRDRNTLGLFQRQTRAEDTNSNVSLDGGDLNIEADKKNSLTANARNSFGALPVIGAIGSGIDKSKTETQPKAEIPKPDTKVEATTPETEAGTGIIPKIETQTESEVEATTPDPETQTESEVEATAPDSDSEIKPEVGTTTPDPEELEPGVVVSFDDVQEGYWAYPFLQELGKQKLLRPTFDNNFEPDAKITRAGMATLISQAFKQSPTLPTKNFTDISSGNTIAKDVDKAVGIGFMKGYSKDEFRPAENIPRYQVLVALATGLGLKPSGDPVTILQGFSDRDEIPNWAIPQVAAATEAGLAVNRPGFELNSLKPETAATRAEVAAMIYQSLKQQNKVPKVESDNIVQLN